MSAKGVLMFKFDRIESQKDPTRNILIDSMVTQMRLTLEMDFPLRDLNRAIFIVTKDAEGGIAGGVCLFKRTIKEIQEDIKDFIPNFPFYQENVWECSGIFFDSLPPSSVESAPLFHDFYRELYNELVEFGTKKGVGFVVMKLTAEIHAASKEFGLWPYIVEIKSGNSSDRLFHGILPLRGSAYEAYRQSIGG
jgi:hypothetical protein